MLPAIVRTVMLYRQDTIVKNGISREASTDGTHLVASRLLGGCNHQKRLIFLEQQKQGTTQRAVSITTASTAIDDLTAGKKLHPGAYVLDT
jgi:hypothetical protein